MVRVAQVVRGVSGVRGVKGVREVREVRVVSLSKVYYLGKRHSVTPTRTRTRQICTTRPALLVKI